MIMMNKYLMLLMFVVFSFSLHIHSTESQENVMSWKYNNKILHPYCFQTEWISSDNLQEYYEHYTGIKENYYNTKEFDDFRVNLGSYWGKEITSFDPIRASWDEDVELAVSIDSCLGKKSKNFSIRNDRVSSSEERDEYGYKIIKEISPKYCQTLAPNIEGRCLKSYLLKIYDWGGGSRGHWITNQVYGLFRLSNNKEYIVPLGKKEPEKFIKEYKEALK